MGSKRPAVQLWLCFAIACVGSLATSFSAENASPTGTIVGRVVDENGKAIACAKLDLEEWRGRDKVVSRASSDDAGRFTLGEVPTGCRFCLSVDVVGRAREFRDELFVYPGRRTDVGDVRLYRGCVCEGRVVDGNGNPVPNVDVTIKAYRHELGHTIHSLGSPWQIKADADGCYATPPLPVSYVGFAVKPSNGLVMVRAAHESIGPEMIKLQIADMLVAPEVMLDGVVTDTSGKPIADAEVGHNPGYGEFVTTKTDALGHFALGGCSAKTVHKARLNVEARGFADYEEPEPADDLPRKIVLSPCRYISGRAIDAQTGEPVQIEQIVICDVKRDADGTPRSYGCGEARFDQPTKGAFHASVSTKGEKHITVMAKGYQTAEAYVLDFGLPGAAQKLTIKLLQTGARTSIAKQRIRGVVTSAAKPAAQVWVSLWQKMEEWDSVNAWMCRGRTVDGTYRPWCVDALTDRDGRYLLDVADPGDYYVVARPPDGSPSISQALHIKSDEEQACDLALQSAGTIRGRVIGVDPDVAQKLWIVAFGHTPFRAATPIDRNGEFVLGNVPAGEIGLKVGHEGYLDADVARFPWSDEVWKKKSEPWQRVVKVAVRSGETVDAVELPYPTPGAPDEVPGD